jgi:hypothetical protein
MKRLFLSICLAGLLGLGAPGWALLRAEDKPATETNQPVLSPEQEKEVKAQLALLTGKDESKYKAAQKLILGIGLPARKLLEDAVKSAPNAEAKERLEKLLMLLPDPAACQMLRQACEAMKNCKGFRLNALISGSMKMKIAGQSQSMPLPEQKMEGFQNGRDFSYTKLYQLKQENGQNEYSEIYEKEGHQVTRQSGSGDWIREKDEDQGEDFINTLVGTPKPNGKFARILERAVFKHTDKFQGVECRVIEIEIKGKDLKETLSKDIIDNFSTIKEVGYQFRAWVGKNNNIIYKIALSVDITGEVKPGQDDNQSVPVVMNMYLDIKISDYDKEIKAEMPDEVKKLLEQ